MEGFSPVDGFLEITECLADMIKYVANEPSVGLFYIQEHTKNAVPNLNSLKNNVVTNSHETALHTEDLEDSISIVRSMKECGFPVADEMDRDIKKSLVIVSTKLAERGLICSPSSFKMGRTSSWGRNAVYDQQESKKSANYISSVIKSAKQKASNIKWPQLDIGESIQRKSLLSLSGTPQAAQSSSASLTMPEMDADELPLSSPVADVLRDDVDVNLPNESTLSTSENYDDFKADRETRLEKWLEDTETYNNIGR